MVFSSHVYEWPAKLENQWTADARQSLQEQQFWDCCFEGNRNTELCFTLFFIWSSKDTEGRVVRAHAINTADPDTIPARGPLLHVTSPLSPMFPLRLLLIKMSMPQKNQGNIDYAWQSCINYILKRETWTNSSYWASLHVFKGLSATHGLTFLVTTWLVWHPSHVSTEKGMLHYKILKDV